MHTLILFAVRACLRACAGPVRHRAGGNRGHPELAAGHVPRRATRSGNMKHASGHDHRPQPGPFSAWTRPGFFFWPQCWHPFDIVAPHRTPHFLTRRHAPSFPRWDLTTCPYRGRHAVWQRPCPGLGFVFALAPGSALCSSGIAIAAPSGLEDISGAKQRRSDT